MYYPVVLAVVVAAVLVSTTLATVPVYNPVANPLAIVMSGSQVRFTVLTKNVIRCEYSQTGEFIDDATFAFVNRYLTVPPFSTVVSNGVLTIDTGDLALHYVVGGGAFSDSNLDIVVKALGKTWKPSLAPTGNLLGTIRTLDTINGATNLYCPSMTQSQLTDSHCTLGLISRDGWVLINDTASPRLDSQSWRWFKSDPANNETCALADSEKIDCNPNSVGGKTQCEAMGCCFVPGPPGIPECFWPIVKRVNQDWYFFGHGHNYLQAFADFVSLSGPHPLLPRYTYGPQYSRWYAYNEEDERLLIEQGFVEHKIPLDVLVLDMDWHTLWNNQNTGCVNYDSWTGFTWNTNLFPDPTRFITWLHSNGLKVTLNNHPNSGVQCIEATYKEMANYWGVDPSTKQAVPYVLQNQYWSAGFFDIVMDPIRDNGVDYWWVDYQQGERMLAPNVNPTWWVNYVFTSNPTWWSGIDRANLMARWGGLGNHRFGQIGFSGDTQTSWDSLAFQPYFTSTASNVGGFLWSHDTGGFEGQPDEELFTRWVQWSAFSPTLRVHCNGKDGFNRDIWLYPYESFKIMREAFQLRASLVPYIATAAYDSLKGIGLLRPMYYYYPENDEAYLFTAQYMFGSQMLVSPVVAAADSNGLSLMKVWIPDGKWVEWFSGRIFSGPATITRQFLKNEIPVYVKAGSVIPMLDLKSAPLLGSASRVPQTLQLTVFPGASAGSKVSSYYFDDDGYSTDYMVLDRWAKTTVDLQTESTGLTLIINPYTGKGFPEMPTTRTYKLKFRGVWPPTSVMINSVSVPFNNEQGNGWTYEGSTLSAVVNIRTAVSTSSTTIIKLTFAQSLQSPLLGTEYLRQLNVMQHCKDSFDTLWPRYYPDDYPTMLIAGQIGLNMTTATAYSDMQQFASMYATAQTEVSLLPDTTSKTACVAMLSMM